MDRNRHAERGQSLVIMAVALVGLLVFVGLAIDGGTMLLERRRMQNAADAAALAGTRELAEAVCGHPDATDETIFNAVKNYASINGVLDPDNTVLADYVDFNETVLGPVGGGTIPQGAAGVSAGVEISRATYFMTLAGLHTSHASAEALGMSGPPLIAGGLRPFGVPVQLVQTLELGDSFVVSFKHNGGTIQWVAQWGQDMEAQHRGWMNMDYVWNQGEDPDFPRAISDQAGADDLKDWMENGWQGTLYADGLWEDGWRYGDYIHAKPGTNSSAICAAPLDTLIYIPIYDYVPDCPSEIPAPKPSCPTQGGSYCYHIVGFVGAKITGCQQGQGEITVELVEVIVGQGVPSPNAGYGSDTCAAHLMVVTLWR